MAAMTPHRPASKPEAPVTFGRKYNMTRDLNTPPPRRGLNGPVLFVLLVIAVVGLLSLTTWLG